MPRSMHPPDASAVSTVDEAIVIDEIGIRIGRYGGLHLKSAYQPIFRHRNGLLIPHAVEALIRPCRAGVAISPAAFFAGVPPSDRMFVESLCRALHLKNHANIGAPGIELFFNYDPRVNEDFGRSLAQLVVMAERLNEAGFDTGMLVCEMTETDCLDRSTFLRLAAEMRCRGIRLAIDDFGAGHSTPDRVQIVEPDFVKIDGAFFRRAASAPAALELLRKLVERMQARGAAIVFEGIETPEQLKAAIDCGADCLQGYLLGRPELAGSLFNDRPRRVDAFLDPPSTVVPMHRRARP